MNDPKKFHKYSRYGAYHWTWYNQKYSYKVHVNFLKGWIQEKSVIDIGAGDGFITSFLNIKGIDNDPDGIAAAASKGVAIDLGDAYALPYRKEEFDSALMSDVVEHFSNVNRALAEARRVIKKYLYVTIPAREKFTEPDHYHRWTPEEFISQVQNQHFKLVEGPLTHYGRNKHYFKFQKIPK